MKLNHSIKFFCICLSLFFSSLLRAQPTLETKVDEYLTPLVNSGDFYGTVLFAKNGYIELVKGYGFSDLEYFVKNNPQTIYHLGSVNKPITAIGVMLLQQMGKLNVDDAIEKYIPNYPKGDEITVKHLLSQTSGIPSYNEFEDYDTYAHRVNELKDVVSWFKNKELLFKPGSKYSYSNSNFVLLAYVIELVSGQTYTEFMYENVFKPLGMYHTAMYKYDEIVENRAVGYDPANNEYGLKPIGFYNNSIKVGSGALYSTVLDLLKLEKALYSDELLNEKTRELMLTSIGDNDYGLGWGIWKRFDKRKYDHDGNSPGSVAYFSTYPDDKVTIIFLGNVNSGVFHQMKYDLAAIYFNKDYKLPEQRTYKVLKASDLKKFEGRYEFQNGNFFDLKIINGDLRFLWRGRGNLGYLLSPLTNYSFYMRARGDQIDFNLNKNGDLDAKYIEHSGTSVLKKVKASNLD